MDGFTFFPHHVVVQRERQVVVTVEDRVLVQKVLGHLDGLVRRVPEGWSGMH